MPKWPLRTQPARFHVAITFLLVNVALAQAPDTFTNLQFFPKDISKADLTAQMRSFAFALNVRCPYCHAESSANDHKLDYASDAKEAKRTARLMLNMTVNINRDYLAKIGTSDPVRVECVTCHRGLALPKSMKTTLSEAMDKNGIDGAIALYRDLRKQYYGSGQYDFGESPLNQLTEILLHANKNQEAAKLMEMNFALNHPDSLWSYHLLAMSHQAAGEKEKARADYQKVLELHPEDTWARQQLDALSGSK